MKTSFWNSVAFVYDLATRLGASGAAQAASFVGDHLGSQDTVLDAACGTGLFTRAIAPRVERVVAADYAPKMLARAMGHVRRAGLTNVTGQIEDLTRLGFADDSFDAAVAGSVLHLLDHPEQGVAELRRVVKVGGTIIIPNYIEDARPVNRRLELITRFGFSSIHRWDEAGLVDFLTGQGLRTTEHRVFAAWQPLCVVVCRN